MKRKINTRVLYTFFSALVILVGSILAIRFAQGYFHNGIRSGTGLLAANSFPEGAQVFVNDKLVSATDNTIYLDPGTYQVEILRDGYIPWTKKLLIENELVTQTNAQLFKQAPGLTPLTFIDVKNISTSPDGEKILFYTASASSQAKDGLYILDMNNNVLRSQRDARQISDDVNGFDLNTANFTWSPDNSQVILSSEGKDVLLDLSKKNSLSTMNDIGFEKKQLLSEWENQLYLRERQFLAKFPDEILNIASSSAENVYLSPDKNKIMYTATASAMLPDNIGPTPPSRNSQPETRTLVPGKTYIYDREEDRNFLVDAPLAASPSAHKVLLADDLFNRDAKSLDASPSAFQRLQASNSAQIARNYAAYYSSLYSTGIQWYPDSKHIIFVDHDRIFIQEYDGTNKAPIYSGPFSNHFVYPWPDGSRLIILTSFSASTPPNLYAVELK